MPFRTHALLALALATAAGPAWAQGSGPPGTSTRPRVVRPDPDDNLQWAASVVQITALSRQGDLTAKLFGTAGGDPAMNGLYTYLAFFESAGDGWRVFSLGDFLSYRVLSETRGRLTLDIRDNVMDSRTGAVGTRARRLLVTWRAGSEPPESVSVTISP